MRQRRAAILLPRETRHGREEGWGRERENRNLKRKLEANVFLHPRDRPGVTAHRYTRAGRSGEKEDHLEGRVGGQTHTAWKLNETCLLPRLWKNVRLWVF